MEFTVINNKKGLKIVHRLQREAVKSTLSIVFKKVSTPVIQLTIN